MINPKRSSQFLVCWRIALLVLAYLVSGKLSLLLAIPPGFVSGIFLPLGISLGAVLIWGTPMLWGVFLGSFLLNIQVSADASQDVSVNVILVAVQIAAGSSLASFAGALLIRHYVGFPDKLTDERKIFAFFVLGGPVATSLSASCGALALYFNGVIHFKQMLFTWWTWWIGDAIGVLIATPLMCIFFIKPRHFWRNRFYTVGVPIIVSSLAVVSIFVLASNNEQKKMEADFKQQAEVITRSVESRLSTLGYSLATLRGLFIASDRVTRDEFSAYIQHVIPGIKGVAGFAWNPYIQHEQRADFERDMQAQGYENFYIKEKDPEGKYEVASQRADYTVISFIEPIAENRILVGLNVGVDPIRSPVLERARDTGAIAMTKPLPLLQHVTFRRGVIVYYPVYTRAHNLSTAAERQQSLAGYVTAIVGLDDLIPTALNTFSKKDFEVQILDITDSAEPLIFYSNLSGQVSTYAKALGVTHELSFGGRRLAVNIIPSEIFLAENRSLQSWFVLAGGLLFCSFLGGFLLLVTGRTQHVRDLVEQRTKELAAVLEHAVESILVVDEQGKVIKANPAAMQLFGYAFDSLHSIDFGRLVPSLRALFLPDGENLKTINWREGIGIRSDGRELPIELSLSPVELQERKFFTVIVHDATAKRKVDRLKNEFISTISQELRTPLTAIKGALDIALSGGLGEVEERLKDTLIIANNNVDRLARLVNDILDIDKLEFSNMQLSTQPTRVYPLLQQSVEQNQDYAAGYGVRLLLENIGEDVKSLCANLDIDRFFQVMANLLSNAIKYSHLGGVVKVTMEPGETALIISVIDEGQGIPVEFRQRIFRKFAQTDSSDPRRRDGTGLGLSITKSIVEKLGGVIDYQSVEGEGSTFFFTLPIIK